MGLGTWPESASWIVVHAAVAAVEALALHVPSAVAAVATQALMAELVKVRAAPGRAPSDVVVVAAAASMAQGHASTLPTFT